jgi:hypothetical protein
MKNVYHLTSEQLSQLKRDLDEMKLRAEEIANFISLDFGSEDSRTVRAQELVASVQRLQWALERGGQVGAECGIVAIARQSENPDGPTE